MPPQRPTITYTAPASFLSTDHWKQVHAALVSQLPLRNLHWKSTSRPTIRTIQELDVEFVAAETRRDEATSQIPQTVLEKTLMSVYIVVCEDADTYKNTVKKQIKDWHTAVTQRKNHEWLVVHIVRPDSKTGASKLFQLRSSVLDKIKADFNSDKRDRCVQLMWSYDDDNPAAWAELINKVKDGVLSAFDAAIIQREEEVKRSEGQRQMPGWNFCTFFILKESLANSFEGMNLHDDALDCYNELEILFFHVLREKNLSWFGTVISPGPEDDSMPLLSVSKKPYRDLILANTISIFDFRIYLLARQCGILNSIKRPIEIAKKVVSFLGAFGRRLRDLEDTLQPFFIESWSYSSALSVFELCENLASGLEMNKLTKINHNAVKGELIEIARHQLDIIGIKNEYLPSEPPFSMALPTKRPTKNRNSKRLSGQISNEELLAALDDKEKFYELYVRTTEKAIGLCASAGRRKFALKLHGDLAALDAHRERLPSALQTFTSLPAHYAPHGWTSMEAYMLLRAINIHGSASKPKDQDWMHVLLQFLRAYVQDFGKDLLSPEGGHESSVTGLISMLKDAAEQAETDVIQVDHPAFAITIVNGDSKTADNRDGALLEISVLNSLPCDIPIDEIGVNVTGRDGARLTFSEKIPLLSRGKNAFTLFCHSATAGTYALHSSQIKMRKLNFQWTYLPASVLKTSKGSKFPTLVRIPKDIRSLDVRLRQPQRIVVGDDPRLIVAFNSGRNDVLRAVVKLSAPSGVTFTHSGAVIYGDEHAEIETTEDSFIVSNVASGKIIQISVPHSDASSYHAMRVNVSVNYTTAVEADVERCVRFVRIILTTLPLAINVQDFFRGTRLFTRFILSTTSHQHVRIRSTELISPKENEGLRVTKSISRAHSIITVKPNQPGQFLFQLDSAKGEERDPVRLEVSYRMLREEVEFLIESAASAVISAYPSLLLHRDALVDTAVQALESDASWVDLYEVTGELVVPGQLDGIKDIAEGLEQMKAILNQPRRVDEVIAQWREIAILVDVPHRHIVAAARLQVTPDSLAHKSGSEKTASMFAGQPISAVLTIKTSFHWVPAEDAEVDNYMMRYDVEELTKDWLVSGRKRGDFIARDEETFSANITLIALHHGELFLPKVGVTALAIPGEMRMKSPVVPSCETHQIHGAETVLILPRGGRNTFVLSMGENV